MRLDCGLCALRLWREGDEPALVRHANSRAVWRGLRDRFPHPYTRADAEEWISLCRGSVTRLAIEVGGEAAGSIALEPGDDINCRTAEIGYWLGEALWGRGIATAAVRVMTGYGFEALGLTRVFAVPLANNPASARVLEKCGYALEGRMRRSAIKEGVVLDQLLYAITDEDVSRAPLAP